MRTLLEDRRPVHLDNARVVFILFVEAHAGRLWAPYRSCMNELSGSGMTFLVVHVRMSSEATFHKRRRICGLSTRMYLTHHTTTHYIPSTVSTRLQHLDLNHQLDKTHIGH